MILPYFSGTLIGARKTTWDSMDSNLLYLHVLVSCQAAAAAERKRSLRRCMVSCTWLASDLPNLMNLPMQPHSFPYFPCLVIIKIVVPMRAAPFHRKDPGPAVAGKRRLHIKELLHCSAATPLSSTSTFAGLVWCKIDHNAASKMVCVCQNIATAKQFLSA